MPGPSAWSRLHEAGTADSSSRSAYVQRTRIGEYVDQAKAAPLTPWVELTALSWLHRFRWKASPCRPPVGSSLCGSGAVVPRRRNRPARSGAASGSEGVVVPVT
ncbi:hypothetical protein [Streptomyces sp. NPDC058373]|uniref:hypothetical protein n=1 Tax=Streptomyces sp. NPDC058373 TaxID=3346465 RepID=UPI0036496191